MRRFHVMAALCVLLLALAAPLARAELARGSKGEDVRSLQSILIDLGFLEDQADGIFGRKTQEAVRKLQRWWGVDETGAADEGVVNDLEILWDMVMGNPRESGAPADGEDYPPFCSWTDDEDSCRRADYCSRHIAQYPLAVQLAVSNPPEKLKALLAGRIGQFWLEAIGDMYSDWAQRDDRGAESAAGEQYAIFRAALDENAAIWNERCGEGSSRAAVEQMMWLEKTGVDLCYDLYGAEPNR